MVFFSFRLDIFKGCHNADNEHNKNIKCALHLNLRLMNELVNNESVFNYFSYNLTSDLSARNRQTNKLFDDNMIVIHLILVFLFKKISIRIFLKKRNEVCRGHNCVDKSLQSTTFRRIFLVSWFAQLCCSFQLKLAFQYKPKKWANFMIRNERERADEKNHDMQAQSQQQFSHYDECVI